MRPLFILRPEPGASATATAARNAGLRPIVMPLFAVEPVAWQAPDPAQFDAILLTSANAVRHAGLDIEPLRSLPVHCVGEVTAEAAREAGLRVASTGSGGVDSLLASLPSGMKLLHLCGTRWRETKDSRHSIERLPVYESVEVPGADRFREMSKAVVAVHSPRAASVLARRVDQAAVPRDSIGIAAISAEAAQAAGSGWETVEAAAEPNDTALLAIAVRLCNNRH